MCVTMEIWMFMNNLIFLYQVWFISQMLVTKRFDSNIYYMYLYWDKRYKSEVLNITNRPYFICLVHISCNLSSRRWQDHYKFIKLKLNLNSASSALLYTGFMRIKIWYIYTCIYKLYRIIQFIASKVATYIFILHYF